MSFSFLLLLLAQYPSNNINIRCKWNAPLIHIPCISNIMSAIKSIIDADMARQQRVNGILKDFYAIQNRFSCSAH